MAYRSDLTDDQWALLEPVFNAPGKRGRKHAGDLRTVVDAMLYIAQTGCQWRYLPASFGAWTWVWSQFRRWSRNRTWAQGPDGVARGRTRGGRASRGDAVDGGQIDIPSHWERVDTDECEFQSERWARPASPSCDLQEGVAFYGSATFDPAHGPGVRRTTENGTPAWGGYTYVGDFAVYASYGDRDLVQDVLASAREAG